jgi:hypothetical protein
MSFSLSSTGPSFFIERKVTKPFLKMVGHGLRDYPKVVRFSGLAVGVVGSILSIADFVTSIVEQLFKGLANVFGSLFFESCHADTGFKQLRGLCFRVLNPLNTLAKIFEAVVIIPSMTFRMAFYPLDVAWNLC